jgi:CheY-specific phosphatase CheX
MMSDLQVFSKLTKEDLDTASVKKRAEAIGEVAGRITGKFAAELVQQGVNINLLPQIIGSLGYAILSSLSNLPESHKHLEEIAHKELESQRLHYLQGLDQDDLYKC